MVYIVEDVMNYTGFTTHVKTAWAILFCSLRGMQRAELFCKARTYG